MKLDARVVRNSESVHALAQLLRDIIANPSAWHSDVTVKTALVSQGALAKLSRNDRGVQPSSINTIKRMANLSFAGGFEALDQLRLSAHDSLNEHAKASGRSGRRSKATLVEKSEALELQNQILKQDLLTLTMAFEKSLVQGRAYADATKDPAIVARCRKEQQELLDMMSVLRPKPCVPNTER